MLVSLSIHPEWVVCQIPYFCAGMVQWCFSRCFFFTFNSGVSYHQPFWIHYCIFTLYFLIKSPILLFLPCLPCVSASAFPPFFARFGLLISCPLLWQLLILCVPGWIWETPFCRLLPVFPTHIHRATTMHTLSPRLCIIIHAELIAIKINQSLPSRTHRGTCCQGWDYMSKQNGMLMRYNPRQSDLFTHLDQEATLGSHCCIITPALLSLY